MTVLARTSNNWKRLPPSHQRGRHMSTKPQKCDENLVLGPWTPRVSDRSSVVMRLSLRSQFSLWPWVMRRYPARNDVSTRGEWLSTVGNRNLATFSEGRYRAANTEDYDRAYCSDFSRLEPGSNTSIVTLLVVGGDEKGTQCLGV
jgi:hypothetical protein